jgi:hypothetical protein
MENSPVKAFLVQSKKACPLFPIGGPVLADEMTPTDLLGCFLLTLPEKCVQILNVQKLNA